MSSASPDPSVQLDPDLRRRFVNRLFWEVDRWREGVGPVLDVPASPELESALAELGDAAGVEALPDLLDQILAASQRVHHPAYLGHQIAAPIDLAALMELLNALLNNGMAIYEMGPVQTAAEAKVVSWMCRAAGWPEASRGHFTSGGTLGNLTALLAARRWAYEGAIWEGGQNEAQAPCILVSGEAHYSVDRAVRIMGWGAGGIERVRVDRERRLDPEDLEAALARARSRGRRVIAVVASACSTAVGSFDPLERIAGFCASNELWMHVDGAHGASFLLCQRGRELMRGIERADSLVWDPHKMMRMPALMTGVLFRDPARARLAFEQDADYLFTEASADPDVGHRSFECTKRGMALTLYACLHVYGESAFEAHVDSLLDTTRVFAELLEAEEDFELAQRPSLNILCFRPRAKQARLLALRTALVRSGKFYLVDTRLDGEYWLRLTIIEGGEAQARAAALIAACRSTLADL
jgi:L-2,4-diaminobutyrate decarboxylase